MLSNQEIGLRIRNVRKTSKMTQVQFAEKMHLTQQMLSRYESGQTPIPNELIESIANQFGIPVSYFLGISSDSIFGDERLLVEYYRKLDDRLKERLLELVRTMSDINGENQKL
jgi:transcriptional regulator with XRE-family HTH domain